MLTYRKWLALPLVAALSVAVGCGDGANITGPGSGGGQATESQVSLSFMVRGVGAPTTGLAAPSFDLVQNDGANTLTITRVAIVLREIELERLDDECDDDSGSGDGNSGSSEDDGGSGDGCEEFETGPMLLELPLDGTVLQDISLAGVAAGMYDEIEFDIHKPEDDGPEDLAFLQQQPDFRHVSIRVEGEFNGSPFTYLTDLNEEQEVDLVPPLVVGENGATNVTLSIDVGTWFVEADGSTLIDPATANKGGPNEQLVEDNIERSIEGFEDSDHDGDDDHGDDD